MSWFLGATLSNALIAAAMAFVVVAVSWYWRQRPAVIHAMWLIVLLKFVTPPMVNVPLSLSFRVHDVPVTSIDEARLELRNALSVRTGAEERWNIAHESRSGSKDTAFQRPRSGLQTEAGLSSQGVVLGCWLIGTGVWMSIAVVRIVRFTRLLRAARCSDDLAAIGDRVARRIGLKQTPAIEVIDAHIGPLVWPVGFRPKIVLPAELVSKLTVDQLELVLAHEMAHVKRGDHWIHWFTLVVLAAYWWHPIVWLAVRRLRVAEEQCCDAMVVAASPGCALAYAETLVQTLDLLVARRLPPVLASGIDSGGSLKRRCEMILSDRTTFRIGKVTGLMLLLAATAILPLAAMSRADEEAKKESAATQTRDAVAPKQDAGNATQEVDDDARLQAVFDAHPHPWHVEGAKVNDCLQCHKIEWGFPKPIGTSLEEWGRKIVSENKQEALDGATQGLRNLGFDEKLIEELITDRAKLRDTNQVLLNILRLNALDDAEIDHEVTRLLGLLRSERLRMPRFPISKEEEQKMNEFLERALNRDDVGADPLNDAESPKPGQNGASPN